MQNHFKNVFGVILAGGSGTRFWPRSRQSHPEQLCKISHPSLTMIEETIKRIDSIIPISKRMIVTNIAQKELTKKVVTTSCQHIIAEPLSRNTAAAIALAALNIATAYPQELDDAVMISFHADHVIKNQEAFLSVLSKAVGVAGKEGKLILVGETPTRAEIGYGYIEKGGTLYPDQVSSCFAVKSFKEKPVKEVAEQYFAQKDQFFWNSGMFVWGVKTILQEFRRYLPQMLAILEPLANKLLEEGRTFADLSDEELRPYYEKVPAISIDQAILEKSKNLAVIAGAMGWLDIGGWTALAEVKATDSKGNLKEGDVLLLGTDHSIVVTDSYPVATLGLKDMIVVVDKGCVLVCPKDRAQDIKLIAEELRKKGRMELV